MHAGFMGAGEPEYSKKRNTKETISLTHIRRLIQDLNPRYSSNRPLQTPSPSQITTNNDKTNCDDFIKNNLMETFIKAKNIIMLAETRFVT